MQFFIAKKLPDRSPLLITCCSRPKFVFKSGENVFIAGADYIAKSNFVQVGEGKAASSACTSMGQQASFPTS